MSFSKQGCAGMHVLFLLFLVPSFTSGFMSSISHKETKKDKRNSRCPLCWAWASWWGNPAEHPKLQRYRDRFPFSDWHGEGLSREPQLRLWDFVWHLSQRGLHGTFPRWRRAKPRTLTWLFVYLFDVFGDFGVLESGFICVGRFRKTSVTISSRLLRSGIYFIHLGSTLFHRHGKGLSRGPYHDYFTLFLELRLCLVNQFGKNLYVWACFSTRSLFGPCF